MQEATLYINGKDFNSWSTFSKILKELLFLDDHLDVKNPAVLDDILYGGYGTLKPREVFTIVWQNYKLSEQKLKPKDLALIKDLLEQNPYRKLQFA